MLWSAFLYLFYRFLASLCNERQFLSTQYIVVGRNEVKLGLTYINLKMENSLQLNGLNRLNRQTD